MLPPSLSFPSSHSHGLLFFASFSLHRVWKKTAVLWLAVRSGDRVLDLCTGTGDLAFLLATTVGKRGSVVALDFAPNILAEARRRSALRPRTDRYAARLDFIEGDATCLPANGVCASGTFDGVTIGYGLRNVADIPAALREACRVLKPGKRLVVLDFNNPRGDVVVDTIQKTALAAVVVPVASSMGMEEEYAYLRPSIEKYPTGEELQRMAREAGFRQTHFYPLAGGLMGCLVATK